MALERTEQLQYSFDEVCRQRLLKMRYTAAGIVQKRGVWEKDNLLNKVINFSSGIQKVSRFDSRFDSTATLLVTTSWRRHLRRVDSTPHLEILANYRRGKISSMDIVVLGFNELGYPEEIVHLFMPPEDNIDPYMVFVDHRGSRNDTFIDYASGPDFAEVGLLEATLEKVGRYLKG